MRMKGREQEFQTIFNRLYSLFYHYFFVKLQTEGKDSKDDSLPNTNPTRYVSA